jgi:hypothetical protein
MDVNDLMRQCNGKVSPSKALVKGLAKELDIDESSPTLPKPENHLNEATQGAGNLHCGSVGGHSPGTRTVGVFLFGLVNECIGDYARIHSCRRALVGSTELARNAGMNAARHAAIARLNAATISVQGS